MVWNRPEIAVYYDELVRLTSRLVLLGGDAQVILYRPLVLSEIDGAATARAGDGILRYQPTQNLLEAMAALTLAADEIEKPDIAETHARRRCLGHMFLPVAGVVTQQDRSAAGAGVNPAPLCYPKRMKTKPIEIPDSIELHPDAQERFERAVDKVMRSPPQHRTAKGREPSPKRGGSRGGKEPA